MKNSIDKYIKENRESLDILEPNKLKMWSEIQKEISQPKKKRHLVFLKYAAIFTLFLSATIFINYIYNKQREFESVFVCIDKNLEKQEIDYQYRVYELSMKVKKQSRKDDEIIEFLYKELKNIDIVYNEAVGEMQSSGIKPLTVKVIFDTYEKRLRVLEQIINESKKIERYEIRYAQNVN